MTRDAFSLLGGVIGAVWTLFNGWYLPGTRMTPGEVALFCLTVVVVLRFLRRIGRVDDASDSK